MLVKVRRLLAIGGVIAVSLAATPAPAVTPNVDRSNNIRELAFMRTDSTVMDFAFQGDLLIASLWHVGQLNESDFLDGRLDGLAIYRILSGPPYLRLISRYFCASGSEGSISVWGDYVLHSIDGHGSESNEFTSDRCNSTDESAGKHGMRIVDISDPRRPKQVKFVEVACASHVHALLPRRDRVYAYGGILAGDSCNDDDPTPAFQIQVVRFFPNDPKKTRVVSTPPVRPQLGCHDVSLLVPRRIAICSGSSPSWSILDASDPAYPEVIATRPAPFDPVLTDSAVAAATWDGDYLAMADLGGGTHASRCDPGVTDSLVFYDLRDASDPQEVGRHAPPAVTHPPDAECGPSRFNILPAKAKGRYIAVVGWRHGGVRVVDFSQPRTPMEIAHWQTPESDVKAAYWYNGRIYSAEMEAYPIRGPSEVESAPGIRVLEMDGTGERDFHYFRPRLNPRTQTRDFR